jgi:hypothetical protein
MMKVPLIFVLIMYSFHGFSQKTVPSYIDVIKAFCANYEVTEDYENFTSFAKKRDGWYVIQIDKMQSDKLLKEHLFFSYNENKYLDISDYYVKPKEPDIDKQVRKYAKNGGGTSDWYNFERIAYYGYNGWYDDMIKDFGKQQNLTDTMYDGIGRAYVNLANNYLWYQSGGMSPDNDTLKRKLGRLEYPSQQRINKVKEAIDNAINQFYKLKKLNPSYKTVIGNANLKLFNEYMHGYNQMEMCGNDLLAQEYLAKAPLSEPCILQAKNYLNSCEHNAILFSYGDNDTYQLWYVQEKFNFRKDILVINNSLLGLPVYIDMFKRKKILNISIPDMYLEDPANDVAYFYENKKETDLKKVIPLKEFLKILYTKKYPSASAEGTIYPTYPYSTASLALPVYKNSAKTATAKKDILFEINKTYYFINDIAMLDIICNNVNKRPVYFTSSYGTPFEKNLIQKGIVYKLLAEDINLPAQNNAEVKGLEKFINEKYTPVLSNGSDLISIDGDNTFFTLYYRIFNYYLEKRDTITLKKWLDKLDAVCPKINAGQINIARTLAYYFIEAGEADKGLSIANQFAQWLYDAYARPASLNGYYNRENYIDELTKTKNYLLSKGLLSKVIDDLLEK